MDALQFFPADADVLETTKGRAFLVKKDIFKNLMWYSMAGGGNHYPLTLETVKKIKAQNRDGIKPEELEVAEVATSKPKEIEPEYADIVGQISLQSLEKTTRKRRDKERSQQQNQQRPQQQNQQQRRPQQGGNQNEQRPAQQQRTPQNKGPQQQGPRPAQQNQEGRPPQNRNRPQGPKPPQQNRGPQQPRKEEGSSGAN